MPVFTVLVLYDFSAGREIMLVQNKLTVSLHDLVDDDEMPPSAFDLTTDGNTEEEVVKVRRNAGKEINLDDIDL